MFKKLISITTIIAFASLNATFAFGAQGQAIVLTDAELDEVHAGGLNFNFDNFLGSFGNTASNLSNGSVQTNDSGPVSSIVFNPTNTKVEVVETSTSTVNSNLPSNPSTATPETLNTNVSSDPLGVGNLGLNPGNVGGDVLPSSDLGQSTVVTPDAIAPSVNDGSLTQAGVPASIQAGLSGNPNLGNAAVNVANGNPTPLSTTDVAGPLTNPTVNNGTVAGSLALPGNDVAKNQNISNPLAGLTNNTVANQNAPSVLSNNVSPTTPLDIVNTGSSSTPNLDTSLTNSPAPTNIVNQSPLPAPSLDVVAGNQASNPFGGITDLSNNNTQNPASIAQATPPSSATPQSINTLPANTGTGATPAVNFGNVNPTPQNTPLTSPAPIETVSATPTATTSPVNPVTNISNLANLSQGTTNTPSVVSSPIQTPSVATSNPIQNSPVSTNPVAATPVTTNPVATIASGGLQNNLGTAASPVNNPIAAPVNAIDTSVAQGPALSSNEPNNLPINVIPASIVESLANDLGPNVGSSSSSPVASNNVTIAPTINVGTPTNTAPPTNTVTAQPVNSTPPASVAAAPVSTTPAPTQQVSTTSASPAPVQMAANTASPTPTTSVSSTPATPVSVVNNTPQLSNGPIEQVAAATGTNPLSTPATNNTSTLPTPESLASNISNDPTSINLAEPTQQLASAAGNGQAPIQLDIVADGNGGLGLDVANNFDPTTGLPDTGDLPGVGDIAPGEGFSISTTGVGNTNVLNVSDASQQNLSALVNVNAAGSVVPVQVNLTVVINSTITGLENANAINLENFQSFQF